MATWEKTIVVDFDDTLSFTKNRDWENAEANRVLITKLNHLYNNGWDIHIVTARGNISCSTREEADKKYRKQIETWLHKNECFYTSLSFEKKLALYYIDDKGITPESFIDSFDIVTMTSFKKEGWSNDEVWYDAITGDVVKCHHEYPGNVIKWYDAAKERGFNVPEIKSLIGTTIRMEKLYEYKGKVDYVIHDIIKFDKKVPLFGYAEDETDLYDAYIKRCTQRVPDTLVDNKYIASLLESERKNTPYTFSHGDAAIDNALSGKFGDKVYWIDPIQSEDLYSSWVIDMGKLYLSVKYLISGHEDVTDLTFEKALAKVSYRYDININTIIAHAIGNACRMFPYAGKESDKLEVVKWINELCNKLKNQKSD